MLQRSSFSAASFGTENPILPIHFGAHLRLLRDRHGLSQAEVVACLDAWQQAAYSKVEKGTRAPLFDQLGPIYQALRDAGVQLTVQDREHFFLLARDLLESRQRRHARQSDEAWSALYARLAEIDGLPLRQKESRAGRLQPKGRQGLLRREIGHLIGREAWLQSVADMLTGPSLAKVLVLHGPTGSGKTSELHRLIHQIVQRVPRSQIVLSEPAPVQLGRLDPADVLERLLADLFEIVGSSSAPMPTSSLQARIAYVLSLLAHLDQSVVIALDNAEHLLDEHGDLTPLWHRFLTQFVQTKHQATLLVASQEWPAVLLESQLLVTVEVPLLSHQEGVQLLRTLGLPNSRLDLLDRAVGVVGGLPVCLEWLVKLVREPFLRDEWAEFEEKEDEDTTLERLLDDPALFGGPVAGRVQPLLDRLLRRLSSEAVTALQDLAVTSVPLGSPALKMLYQTPSVLRELREASLLVAYPQRVQLLPMVAAQVQRKMTDEQVHVAEERLIQALRSWLQTGIATIPEQSSVLTEFLLLLLKHRHLLEAAEIVIEFGWMSSRYEQGARLARQLCEIMTTDEWQTDPQSRIGGTLLYYSLARFRGKKLSLHDRAEAYQQILAQRSDGAKPLQPATIAHLVQHCANHAIVQRHFPQARMLLDHSLAEAERQPETDQVDMLAPLLKTKAHALNAESEQEDQQGNKERARFLREEALRIDQQCVNLLRKAETGGCSLKQNTVRYHLARTLNEIGYFLVNLHRGKEAREVLEESIRLKRQGYAQTGSLAMSLGEMGQALELTGKFQEALQYNAQALKETQQLAASGHATAQGDIPVHLINRARLLLRVGNFAEAEQLIDQALPSLRESRSVYRQKAHEVLEEIRACRATLPDLGREYLDWRWYRRYKQAIAFDVFGWLTHAGPFSLAEEQEWKSLHDRKDEQAQERREQLMKASRDRELEKALTERREPHLLYPAIDLEEVQARFGTLQSLAAEIEQEEPNAIVRNLYRAAIEEQMHYLRMVEATFRGDSWAFWEHNRSVHAEPTHEEMKRAFSSLLQMLVRGGQHETTKAVSANLLQRLQHIGDPLILRRLQPGEQRDGLPGTAGVTQNQAQDQRFLAPTVAKCFFEAVLREYGFAEWRVQLDHATNNFRIEANVQTLFLPAYKNLSVSRIRELLGHEIEFHVLRAEAGKRTPLALLADGTRNFLTIDEGMAVYYDQQTAQTQHQVIDETSMTTWIGTLATGLAAGVLSTPQTFFPLQQFLEQLYLLDRLMTKGETDLMKAQATARRLAWNRCLRTYRGVPDLTVAGICYAKDAIYLRGYLQVQQAVKEDPGVLDRLMVGKMAYEDLEEIKELGITTPSISPRWYAQRPDLDAYILSFADSSDGEKENC